MGWLVVECSSLNYYTGCANFKILKKLVNGLVGCGAILCEGRVVNKEEDMIECSKLVASTHS